MDQSIHNYDSNVYVQRQFITVHSSVSGASYTIHLTLATRRGGMLSAYIHHCLLVPQPATYGNALEGGNILVTFTVMLLLVAPEAPFSGMLSSHNLGTPTKFTSNLAVYSMLQLEQYTDQTYLSFVLHSLSWHPTLGITVAG